MVRGAEEAKTGDIKISGRGPAFRVEKSLYMSPTGGPAPPSSFRLLRALRVGAEQGAGQDCSGSASSRRSRRRGRARHVGVAKWAWSAGGGAGLWDPGSPRTLQELPPPQPAPLRSHRFLSRDLDSAAMSATEEVDGLGVSRPHYGSVLDKESQARR